MYPVLFCCIHFAAAVQYCIYIAMHVACIRTTNFAWLHDVSQLLNIGCSALASLVSCSLSFWTVSFSNASLQCRCYPPLLHSLPSFTLSPPLPPSPSSLHSPLSSPPLSFPASRMALTGSQATTYNSTDLHRWGGGGGAWGDTG